jgi:hypothetical protein
VLAIEPRPPGLIALVTSIGMASGDDGDVANLMREVRGLSDDEEACETQTPSAQWKRDVDMPVEVFEWWRRPVSAYQARAGQRPTGYEWICVLE